MSKRAKTPAVTPPALKTLSVRLDANYLRSLKAEAAKRGFSLRSIVEVYLEQFLHDCATDTPDERSKAAHRLVMHGARYRGKQSTK